MTPKTIEYITSIYQINSDRPGKRDRQKPRPIGPRLGAFATRSNRCDHWWWHHPTPRRQSRRARYRAGWYRAREVGYGVGSVCSKSGRYLKERALLVEGLKSKEGRIQWTVNGWRCFVIKPLRILRFVLGTHSTFDIRFWIRRIQTYGYRIWW